MTPSGRPSIRSCFFATTTIPRPGNTDAVVLNLLRGAALLTLLVLGSGLFWLWRRDPAPHQAR